MYVQCQLVFLLVLYYRPDKSDPLPEEFKLGIDRYFREVFKNRMSLMNLSKSFSIVDFSFCCSYCSCFASTDEGSNLLLFFTLCHL